MQTIVRCIGRCDVTFETVLRIIGSRKLIPLSTGFDLFIYLAVWTYRTHPEMLRFSVWDDQILSITTQVRIPQAETAYYIDIWPSVTQSHPYNSWKG